MNNDTTQNTHHADAPTSADAPGCAVASPPENQSDAAPPSNAVQSAVLAALNESEQDALLHVDATGDASPIYGGLSRYEVAMLIRSYQAGTIDLFAFGLALAWRRGYQNPSVKLQKATTCYFQAMYGKDELRPQAELNRATIALHNHDPATVTRALVGYANWRRIKILEYMLQNPKPAYQIREFVRVLAANGLLLDRKDIRAFCKEHNIARDSRRGRPTKKGMI